MRETSLIRFAILVLALFAPVQPVFAHNTLVHFGMGVKAYAMLMEAERLQTSGAVPPAPAGVDPAEWTRFFSLLAKARVDLDAIAAASGGPTPDTATLIGNAAARADNNQDDTHLFVKPTSTLGFGAAQKIGDKAIETGVAIALAPIVCVGSCLFSLISGHSSACDSCISTANDLAKKVPEPSDIDNLVPGIGDVKSDQFVGLWHFINMAPAARIDNEYDDHQGMLYEQAGPSQVPGAIDIAIMAGTDLAGLSVNPSKSQGVEHYEIANPNDDGRDGDVYNGSKIRGDAAWQKYPMGHTPFSPVDNLALYGWNQFKGPDHTLTSLGFGLHAIGDATVPMHVTGTTGWGHRPYEEAQERLWPALSGMVSTPRVLAKAFAYRRQILAWRAASGASRDLPIRWLVRAVARDTYKYALDKNAETSAINPLSPWPFNDVASTMWHTVVGEDPAIAIYQSRSDALALELPLIEDGIAAQVAFLASATENPGHADAAPPALFRLAAYQAPSQNAAVALLGAGSGTAAKRKLKSSAAEEQFLATLRVDYARLAQQLITRRINVATYLQVVRDRSRKAKLALSSPPYLAALVRGDKDGDLVPDSRDRSNNTPPLSATDDKGREQPPPANTGRPQGGAATGEGRTSAGPADQDVADVLAHLNLMVSPACGSQAAPATPELQRLGYSNGSVAGSVRDLMFGVTPVAGATTQCPIFYEFGVHLAKPVAYWAPYVPAETYREAVFRSDQNWDVNPAGLNRLIFRIRRIDPQSADRAFLLQNLMGAYQLMEWRVRAINANGMASAWSEWRPRDIPVSYGEP